MWSWKLRQDRQQRIMAATAGVTTVDCADTRCQRRDDRAGEKHR